MWSMLDANQVNLKKCMKTEIFLQKVLVVREKVVPLHPLSGRDLMSTKKEFFESLT